MSFDIRTLLIGLLNLTIIAGIGYISIKLTYKTLRGKALSKKLLNLSIMLYMIILFASFITFYAIPPSKLSKRIDYNIYKKGIEMEQLEIMDQAQFEELRKNAIIIKKSTEYLTVKDHVLIIPSSFNQRILATTVHNTKNSDKVKLEWYVSKNIYNGIDITDFVKTPSIGISKNQLNISGEYTTNLNFYEYSRDITQSQFLNEPGVFVNKPFYGVKLLVLTIPDDMELSDTSNYVTILK